jgi:DNA-binding CsgD family transcriptional regulator
VALDNLGDSEGALAVLRPQPPHPPHRPGGAGGSPLLQFGVALVRFRQGEWDDALAEAEAGLLAAEETGLHLGAFWACSIGALVNGARGDLDEARRWLGRSHALSPRGEPGMEWLLYATATLHEAEGDVGSAAAILDAIAQALIEARAPALLLTGAPDMVRLAVITGRTEHAARVVAELDAMTRRTASPVVAAVARWTRALVDESQDPDHAGNSDNSGDADRADRADRSNAIEAAADQLAARGRLPEAARAWHDAAVYAVRRGRSREGRRLATRAFEVYDRLGAHHWHRRLRSDLRAHDVVMRPRRGPPRPSYGWESLTASESAIVDLAGQGLTNTEIAARLFVSRRTVESHLGRIYTKLGLSSRAQLVAAIARRRAERGG